MIRVSKQTVTQWMDITDSRQKSTRWHKHTHWLLLLLLLFSWLCRCKSESDGAHVTIDNRSMSVTLLYRSRSDSLRCCTEKKPTVVVRPNSLNIELRRRLFGDPHTTQPAKISNTYATSNRSIDDDLLRAIFGLHAATDHRWSIVNVATFTHSHSAMSAS